MCFGFQHFPFFPDFLILPLDGEVSVGEDEGGDQGPHVDGEAEPRGDDLDPDRAHVGRDGLDGDLLAGGVPEKVNKRLIKSKQTAEEERTNQLVRVIIM